MLKNNNIFTINKKAFWHIIFWMVMLVYYMSSAWALESNKLFLFERMFFKVIVQAALTYCVILVFIPFLLNKKRRISFAISLIIGVYISYVIYTGIRCYYLVPKYPEIFLMRPPLIFYDRITNVFAFLSNIVGLIFPTTILMVFEYYQHEKEVLSLKEQKRTSELEALKNQLNPHFLFNTLNNLYALALKKSEQTPEVIARLSEILDYILYRCNDDFVLLADEIKLLENYISLEKVRYGKRLNISLSHQIKEEVKIAPLLLLTFLENAFKHGVSQEINEATIEISITTDDENIFFKIKNSKPQLVESEFESNREAIGLQNIKKQLKLLYPQNHQLTIDENKNYFSATLKLISK